MVGEGGGMQIKIGHKKIETSTKHRLVIELGWVGWKNGGPKIKIKWRGFLR